MPSDKIEIGHRIEGNFVDSYGHKVEVFIAFTTHVLAWLELPEGFRLHGVDTRDEDALYRRDDIFPHVHPLKIRF